MPLLPSKSDAGAQAIRENVRERVSEGGLMSFGDHLEELRKRIIVSILGIVPIFVIAFAFGRPLLSLLIEPASEELLRAGMGSSLQATAPFETFGAVLHISIVVTVLLGSPWLLYQLWLFVAPGLYAHERRFVHFLLPLSAVLAITALLFVYFAILPVILEFFVTFGSGVGAHPVPTVALPADVVLPSAPVLAGDPIAPEIGQYWFSKATNQLRVCLGVDSEGNALIRGVEMVAHAGIVQQYKVSEYLKTLMNLALGFGIGFQLPVVVVMLGWVGIVERTWLARYRKHATALAFVAGAVLTPADPVSMILLAVPLVLLYEFGMILLWLFPAERVARGLLTKEPDGDADDE